MISKLIIEISFIVTVFTLLVLDLGIFQKKAHASNLKESIYLTIFYVIISLLFAVWIYIAMSPDKSYEFLTGYVVEKSLSFDNLFVFLTIFTYFNVSLKYQHRVLFLGIVGALITRGLFIAVGITAIQLFEPLIYAFGIFLIYTSIKIIRSEEDPDVNPEKNRILKLVGKYFPVKKDYVGGDFFTKSCNKWMVTPLFIVLIAIESTDIMFATDSVPAVISITQDPFIVYTSNIFAILGLRALYFVIAAIMPSFEYLRYGVAIVLAFIGAKMLISSIYKIPTSLSLIIVLGCLTISIISSILKKPLTL